jgi:hypothetical protein
VKQISAEELSSVKEETERVKTLMNEAKCAVVGKQQ